MVLVKSPIADFVLWVQKPATEPPWYWIPCKTGLHRASVCPWIRRNYMLSILRNLSFAFDPTRTVTGIYTRLVNVLCIQRAKLLQGALFKCQGYLLLCLSRQAHGRAVSFHDGGQTAKSSFSRFRCHLTVTNYLIIVIIFVPEAANENYLLGNKESFCF